MPFNEFVLIWKVWLMSIRENEGGGNHTKEQYVAVCRRVIQNIKILIINDWFLFDIQIFQVKDLDAMVWLGPTIVSTPHYERQIHIRDISKPYIWSPAVEWLLAKPVIESSSLTDFTKNVPL